MVIGSQRNKVINKNIKVSDEDIKLLHEIDNAGYKIVYQLVPTVEAQDFMPMLKTVE